MIDRAETPRPVAIFAECARSFCEFVDTSSALSLEARLLSLAHHLANLYALGLQLPNVEPAEDVPSVELPRPRWAGAGEHTIYLELFDPYEDEKPVAGSIDDDVEDIYADLQRGLVLYESHWQTAVWEWRFGLRTHWGDHAVDGLRALQRAISARR